MMKPKEIRRQARISLEGNYFFAVNLTISLTLFTMALTLLLQSSNLAVSNRSFDQALFWILTVIVTILSALLSVGLIRFLYSLCLKKPVVQPGMLFYAFRMQPDTFILTFVFRYLVRPGAVLLPAAASCCGSDRHSAGAARPAGPRGCLRPGRSDSGGALLSALVSDGLCPTG